MSAQCATRDALVETFVRVAYTDSGGQLEAEALVAVFADCWSTHKLAGPPPTAAAVDARASWGGVYIADALDLALKSAGAPAAATAAAAAAADGENDDDENDDDDDDDDDEPYMAYMFDAAAATVERSLALEDGVRVAYVCLAEDGASGAEISGHSVWPAAKTLATHLQREWASLPTASALELGCGCGLVGLAAAVLGCGAVRFTDRDDGALRLVERSLDANGARARGTTGRLAWGAEGAVGERYDLVLGSDLIYDSGVVAPLVATAAASLAVGGAFLLAQSFALGAESTAELVAACARSGLRLRRLRDDGAATLWEAAGVATVGDLLAARGAAFDLTPRAFLPTWRGGVALAFTGWPRPAEALRRALAAALDDALPAEAEGSKWPKITLGAPVAGAPDLDADGLAALARALGGAGADLGACGAWRVRGLANSTYACRSHEKLVDVRRSDLAPATAAAAAVSASAAAYVDAVLAEVADPAYLAAANGPWGDYRSVDRGSSLVAFLRDGDAPGLRDAIAAVRRRVEAAFPGRYAWFDDAALHCTVRALAP